MTVLFESETYAELEQEAEETMSEGGARPVSSQPHQHQRNHLSRRVQWPWGENRNAFGFSIGTAPSNRLRAVHCRHLHEHSSFIR